VGLGLEDERDISVKALEAVRSCERIYLEMYTSILMVSPSEAPMDTSKLEAFYGKPVTVADREMVESNSDEILRDAQTVNVAFLVVGDPFGATTHTDLQIRAREEGIPVEVFHNASIMNAVGACGLQLYRYGEAVSIVFFEPNWRPDSFYDKIKRNRAMGLHTLCLLDIKVKEPNLEYLCKTGKTRYDPPRYMSIRTAVEELLEIEDRRGEGVYSRDSLCVGLARVGCSDQKIVAGRMEDLLEVDFGGPLHSMVIAGECHDMEFELLQQYMLESAKAVKPDDWDLYRPESGVIDIPPLYRRAPQA